MGVTYTADYPNHANPDATNTLHVDLTESNGELMSYTSGQQSLDSGTSAFTGSGQTVFVTIYDPSRSGTGTIHVDSTNANATTPGYVYLGTITSTAAGTSGGTGGSSGSGGPQDPGTVGTYHG